MRTFSMTDIGRKRETNEDCAFVSERPLGNAPNLLAIADGMGGHNAGGYASSHAVEILKEAVGECEKTQPEDILKEGILKANRGLLDAAEADKTLAGMGTTMVAAIISDKTLYFANVGDSRLYLIDGGIRQLSKDHSFVQEMVRLGGINAEDAKHHPDRNLITRAVGVGEKLDIDFFEYRLKKGDIILMCTDGLTNMVEDEEIFRVVKGARDLVEAAGELINTANQHGGRDNIGVILAQPFAGEDDL